MTTAAGLYLSSRSPRRRELLDQIDMPWTLVDADVDERVISGEQPAEYVERLARAKADAGATRLTSAASSVVTDAPVLGADTCVAGDLDGNGTSVILGKPRDLADARRMLSALSGRAHQVHTAMALTDGRRMVSCVSTSTVWFRVIQRDEIDAYWASGEPADKAGAYAIQGRGALFVERMEGSYSGVVGLALFELGKLLEDWATEDAE